MALRLLLFLVCATLPLLADNPWPGVEYAEARAYYYNASGEDGAPLVKDGELHKSVVNKGGTVVPPEQVKALLTILNTRKLKSLRPACYRPRHGVVFYDRDKKVVAFYEVCFECLLQRSEPDGIAPLTHLPSVADLFENLKLPISPHGKTAQNVRKEWETIFGPESEKSDAK